MKANMKKISIVIVEDNSIVMLELKDRLEEMGYQVVDTSPSGLDALNKIERHRPDLIMMDIRLKGEMDGIDTAARIRKELDIPIIYLTAHTDDDTIQRAKLTEPYGYIIKPFEERELFSVIEMALYKHLMEKKLKESKNWLSATLQSIGDALIATDSKGNVKIFNHVAEDITGWNSRDAYGKNINDIFKIKNNENPVLISLNYHSIVGMTNKILIGKKGKETPVDFSSAPIKDENQVVSGIVIVFRDITERNRAKELIERQRLFLRQIIDTDPNYISVKDSQGKFELSNKAAAEALGTSAEEIVGRYDIDFFSNEEIENLRKIDRSVIEKLEEIYIPEDKLIDAKGEVHLLQTFKRAIDSQDGNEKLILSVASDITELKQTEKALRESEERIRTLLKAIPDIVIRYQRNGTILDYHVHDSDLLFPGAEIIGGKIYNVLDKGLAEKILLVSEKAVETSQMQIFEYESTIDNKVNYKEVRIVNLPAEQPETLKDECIIILRDITKRKIAQAEMVKYLSELQQSKNVLEQKNIELSNLNKKLNESEHELKTLNASKDKFFSIIAHDLRSPFTSLLGYSEYLASDYNMMGENELKDISGNLYKSARSTYILLENLLQWARIRTGRIKFRPEAVSLKIIMKQMFDLYKSNTMNKNISLNIEVNTDLNVVADLNMVEAIFRNLISNSIKFTNPGGKINVSAKEKFEFVEISIQDNGVGIKPEVMEKLFQIDQNISTVGTQNEEGSGFGLILCKEFIEMNRGQIFVESKLGEGSVFSFTLPLIKDQ